MPHAQFARLAAVPSVRVHNGITRLAHWLLALRQNSPVVAASQSAVPHAQFTELAAVPSVVAQ